MAYNPQYPPLNSVSILFLISLLMMTHLSIATAREIPTTTKNSEMKKPDRFIDRDGSVLIPGVGRFMVPSLGGISGKIDDSQGFGGIVGSYVPGGDSRLMSNTEVKVSETTGSTSSTPTALSFYHPGVKVTEPSGGTSSTSTMRSFYHPGGKVAEPSGGTSSTPTMWSFYHHGVKAAEPTSPSFDHPGVKALEPSGSTSSTPTLPSFYHPGVKISEPAPPSS